MQFYTYLREQKKTKVKKNSVDSVSLPSYFELTI